MDPGAGVHPISYTAGMAEAVTTMKITNAVQSLAENAALGEMRSFCTKISAPISAVSPPART